MQLINVLIESDWNLKGIKNTRQSKSEPSINRIRLEFKAYKSLYQRIYSLCINRIRLEFKGRGSSNNGL